MGESIETGGVRGHLCSSASERERSERLRRERWVEYSGERDQSRGALSRELQTEEVSNYIDMP